MNDDTINDLKQFIATTVSQQMSDLATKEDIKKLDEKLSSKIDDLLLLLLNLWKSQTKLTNLK